jgi:LytS/YehU family sensor histidine kinase
MPTTSFRRALLFSAAGWIGLAVLRTAVRVVMIPRPPDEAALALLRALLVLAPWIIATPLVLRLASSQRWTRGGRRRSLLVHAGALPAVWLADATWAWLALGWTGTPLFVGFPAFVVAQLEQTVFIYAALVALAVGAGQARRYRAATLAATRLEARLLEARLHVLALQLQPHFLFNTLNAVTELVHRDPAAARRVLRNLRELLEGALDRDAAQEIPVRQELALLDSYVQIQRLRFADSLDVHVEAAPETLDALVPRLVLQPLVENAIRHGTSRRSGPGTITVQIGRSGRRVRLEVEDDGVGLPGRGVREGLGLGNTRERLTQLYGGDFSLALQPAVGRGSVARLEVPLRVEVPRNRAALPEAAGLEIEDDTPAATQPGSTLAALSIAGAWIALGVLGAQQDFLFTRLTGEPSSYLSLLAERMLEATLWIGLTPLVVRLASRLARRAPGPAALVAMHLTAAVAVAVTHMLGMSWLASAGEPDPNLGVVRVLINLCVYAAVAGATHAWTLQSLATERALEAARLERELAGTRLDALRWQLQPEFLLTALDAIAQRCEEYPDEAEELTTRLGDLLRALLAGVGSDAAPLEREVAFLEAYLEVERATGSADVRLQVTLLPGTGHAEVPVRLLQSLAAVVGRADGGVISVRAERRGAELRLEVEGGLPAQAGGEVEARQVLQRWHGTSGAATLELRATSAGSIAIVRLPWHEHRSRHCLDSVGAGAA